METMNKVLETLKANAEPMKAGDIAEATGLDKKAITAALTALKADGSIISPKRCYYSAK
ncbi:MarR family transcriptional regulator [Sporanaerobium hydrogeniformans]|uniref:MarR family transcriptional regulator n=2 Tax=Sporanaerobium hydrogeniformans TaxID=3072179 RepID=A0AC61D7M4_9FIRM|nr:MarR family transcriptional regulator [Sporanaerobium hydrogeniformans]